MSESKDRIIEIMLGAVIARAVYVAAELKLVDYLQDKPLNIQQLSVLAGADERSLYRLMRMLVGHQIFIEKEGGYCPSKLGECLLSEGSQSLRHFI